MAKYNWDFQMKLFLTNFQSPGDILMLTSCVRDLKKSHPEIGVNVQTSAMELWNNNPYLDGAITKSNADKVVEMHYPLINQSTQGQFHFIHGFRLYQEEQLGMRISAGKFCVDIHLSEQEKNDIYITNVLSGANGRKVWLVDAGYKSDFTCKMWEFARFQEVVDRTSDRIMWVQIGAGNHNHKPLENVVNLLGKTTHRQLISLMYRADGVLTPVSYPMHLATMEWKDHQGEHRPCVVVAGSREPRQWECYPTHRYLDNCGLLPCARRGACWKSRVEKLNDGSKQDNSICTCPIATGSGQVIPRCLDMISADDVVREIERCLDAF